MHARTVLAPSLLTLGLLLAGCGGSDAAPEDEAPQGTPPADDDAGDRLPGIIGADATIASLRIEVSHPDIEPIVYEVGCWGDTFPVTPTVDGVDGAAGCARLEDDAVRSRLLDGPPTDVACTEQFGGPDEARITGDIDGQAVDTVIDRVNGCGIADWDLLLPLLPPPLGVTE